MPIHVHPVAIQRPIPLSPLEAKFDECVKKFNDEAKIVVAYRQPFNQRKEALQSLASRILNEYNEYLMGRVFDNQERSDLWVEMKERLDTRVHVVLTESFSLHERPVVDVLDIIAGRGG